jgi:hypothetical protein
VSQHRHTLVATSSTTDALAAAILGFVLGVCVNAAGLQLHWLLWVVSGH